MKKEFYSNGKLLISGEYLVMKGALALAIPVKFGQKMIVEEHSFGENNLEWKSYDHRNDCWAEVLLSKSDLLPFRGSLKTIDPDIYETLKKILIACRTSNPAFLKNEGKTSISNFLNFDRNWGLGSSSTLLNNLAQFANIDAFQLNKKIFGGSGYDIACAKSNQPLLFRIDEEGEVFDTVNFNPPEPEHIYFIYLGQKQNSKDAVTDFMDQKKSFHEEIEIISEITEALLFCDDFPDFMQLLDEHEQVMEYVLQQERIQTKLFSDFNGTIKSLGAWGGDFMLAASEMDPSDIESYFKAKNLHTIFSYEGMALNPPI